MDQDTGCISFGQDRDIAAALAIARQL